MTSSSAALVVGVLLRDREWEAEPAVALLEAIEGAVSIANTAHLHPRCSSRP
jgi:hypothetical protein